jgi:hypothetical protein
MTKNEIIGELYGAYEWIVEVLNGQEREPHIKEMLEGIDNAIDKLRMNVIEVDIAFYHPEDENGIVDETTKVYDEEGMREEFEYKMDCIIKNAGL